MPTYVSKDGKHKITTSNAREGVQLKASGYRQVKEDAAPTTPAAPIAVSPKSTADTPKK